MMPRKQLVPHPKKGKSPGKSFNTKVPRKKVKTVLNFIKFTKRIFVFLKG
jgi:hypothetical protein